MQKSKTRRQATLALIAFGLGASSWLVSRPPGAAESLLSHVDMARSSASTSPARTLHTRTASRVDRQLESRTDLSEGRVSALEAAYATN